MKYEEPKKRWVEYNSLFTIPSDYREKRAWCTKAFGEPDGSNWDYHNTWIYIYKEEYATAYRLRWG